MRFLTSSLFSHRLLPLQLSPIHTARSLRWYNSDSSFSSLLLEKNLTNRSNTISDVFRCTVFAEDGSLTYHSKDMKKSELFTRHGLLPRDLRNLDKDARDIVPLILIRPNSILITLLNIRALIKSDEVILFNVYGTTDTHSLNLFMMDLESKLKTTTQAAGIPYEIRALEAIFINAVSNLATEIKVHSTLIKNILGDLEEDIDKTKLRYLLIESKKLTAFYQKATLIRDIIDEILEQDDELNGLYLTARSQGTPRCGTDHAEVEMLLESYYKHVDEIVRATETSVADVKTTEEIINIILDSNRNQLMLLSLRFSIGLLSLGIGVYISALYGMNLENFIEETDYGMGVVVVGSFVCVGGLFGFSLFRLNKLQRVTMMGN
ncbi:hypothetical protein BABINDRAFT_161606 [Babjeviella inositovora NRRL Y-12698]|uniref:Magnesium transporter n=1 Tax=Babjeviella inositovora NRRL Y-12698 TaxID=984486 RepID=A0A1E3QSE6_9ASCO|nr:uncharacterized protein BABINDRAFT_161606 [Babjeviella inositovora NRRL Y-12698]ODQ79942.1 hypothetical protein BABINDRAFT_161606 [Babjeviella inositovora NRRL Y-12698]